MSSMLGLRSAACVALSMATASAQDRIATGSPAEGCLANAGSHYVHVGDHIYRTLDGADPADTTMGPPNEGGQPHQHYLRLPAGYVLAPNDSESRAVADAHGWSTNGLVLADNTAWFSANHPCSTSRFALDNGASCMGTCGCTMTGNGQITGDFLCWDEPCSDGPLSAGPFRTYTTGQGTWGYMRVLVRCEQGPAPVPPPPPPDQPANLPTAYLITDCSDPDTSGLYSVVEAHCMDTDNEYCDTDHPTMCSARGGTIWGGDAVPIYQNHAGRVLHGIHWSTGGGSGWYVGPSSIVEDCGKASSGTNYAYWESFGSGSLRLPDDPCTSSTNCRTMNSCVISAAYPPPPPPPRGVQDMKDWIASGTRGAFELVLQDDVDGMPQFETALGPGQELTVRCDKQDGALCSWPGTFVVGEADSSLHLSRLGFSDIDAGGGSVVTLSGPRRDDGVFTGSAYIEGCTFTRCTGTRGSGFFMTGGFAVIHQCHFMDNVASEYGGAMMWYPEVTELHVSECTFEGNQARTGAAIDIWGGWMAGSTPPQLKWAPYGYDNEQAATLLPYSYRGCTDTCQNGFVMRSDGCHICSEEEHTCSGTHVRVGGDSVTLRETTVASADGYANNDDCRYELSCPAGSAVRLHFLVMDTELGYDFVNVFDGDSPSAIRLGRFDGSDLPADIEGSGSTMLVQLTSDNSVVLSGFTASFTCLGSAGDSCQGVICGTHGRCEEGHGDRAVSRYRWDHNGNVNLFGSRVEAIPDSRDYYCSVTDVELRESTSNGYMVSGFSDRTHFDGHYVVQAGRECHSQAVYRRRSPDEATASGPWLFRPDGVSYWMVSNRDVSFSDLGCGTDQGWAYSAATCQEDPSTCNAGTWHEADGHQGWAEAAAIQVRSSSSTSTVSVSIHAHGEGPLQSAAASQLRDASGSLMTQLSRSLSIDGEHEKVGSLTFDATGHSGPYSFKYGESGYSWAAILPVSTAACVCDVGYYGSQCETFDPCHNMDCGSHGGCDITSGTCVCEDGYSGPHCRNFDDPCLLMGCGSHGTCNVHDGAAVCACDTDYTGTHCERFDPCLTVSCGSHGRCEAEGHSGACQCDDGYSGRHCEVYDSCYTVSCGSHGWCSEGSCQCDSGWSGDHCTEVTDPCRGVSCGSHGRCHDVGKGVARCECDAGFFGEHCGHSTVAATWVPGTLLEGMPGTTEDHQVLIAALALALGVVLLGASICCCCYRIRKEPAKDALHVPLATHV